MKKYLALLLSVLLLMAMFAGCGNNAGGETPDGATPSAPTADTRTKVNVTAISGPTGVGLVNLMKKQSDGTSANNYTFNVVTAPDQAVAAITNGSADIAAVPTNLAASLFQKTGGKVQILAVNTECVLHILAANSENINSIKDLKGKTIYTSGKGANPEYILDYVLKRNGLTVGKDINVEFVADNDTLATMVINGTAKVAMVPEPKASVVLAKNQNVKRVLNMNTEWIQKDGKVPLASEITSYPLMGCVIARTEFVQQNQQAIRDFLAEYKASIEGVKANVEAAATLCENYKILPNAAIAKAAIPHCALTYLDALDMRRYLHPYLNVLFEYNPNSIGGKMPGVVFYYYDKK